MRRAAENGVQEQKIQAIHITSKIRISSEAGNEPSPSRSTISKGL
jgi:hypothetical protein